MIYTHFISIEAQFLILLFLRALHYSVWLSELIIVRSLLPLEVISRDTPSMRRSLDIQIPSSSVLSKVLCFFLSF